MSSSNRAGDMAPVEVAKLAAGIGFGILLGYVLQPVPNWMNRLFDNSQIAKFLILMAVGSTMLPSFSTPNVAYLAVICASLLALMHLARTMDKDEKDER